jgi:hypothetical protein
MLTLPDEEVGVLSVLLLLFLTSLELSCQLLLLLYALLLSLL